MNSPHEVFKQNIIDYKTFIIQVKKHFAESKVKSPIMVDDGYSAKCLIGVSFNEQKD
jgi:hypothetical protein